MLFPVLPELSVYLPGPILAVGEGGRKKDGARRCMEKPEIQIRKLILIHQVDSCKLEMKRHRQQY